MAMTAEQALSNLMVAITGDDVLQSGLFVGTYKQHAILQDSIEILSRALKNKETGTGVTEGKQNTSDDTT